MIIREVGRPTTYEVPDFTFGISTQIQTQKTPTQKIMELEFNDIKRKLMMPEPEGKGWTQEEADEAEKWYRRFLTLMVKFPENIIVPNVPIDAFWHMHILDTKKYARDSQEVFGRFLHHFPYFGLNGDAAERDDAFVDTNKLYRMEFGEDCTTSATSCTGGGSGTGCSQGCRGG